MPAQSQTVRHYAPRGTTAGPVFVRLEPAQRERLERFAAREHRSLAAACRLGVIRMLDDYDRAAGSDSSNA